MDKESVAILSFCAITILATIGAVAWISYESCLHAWADSGMPVRWAILSGCQVQRKDGTWVPSTAIKDIKQ